MAGTDLGWLSGARAITVVILGLGVAGCYTAGSYFEAVYGAGQGPRPPMPYVILVSTIGGVAMVSAIIALIGGSSAALTTLVVAMIALWVLARVRHLTVNRTRELASTQ